MQIGGSFLLPNRSQVTTAAANCTVLQKACSLDFVYTCMCICGTCVTIYSIVISMQCALQNIHTCMYMCTSVSNTRYTSCNCLLHVYVYIYYVIWACIIILHYLSKPKILENCSPTCPQTPTSPVSQHPPHHNLII